MKDLSTRCIFSGSAENLNTVMEITLDDEKYKIAVSDEYADDASIGAIKKLIPERIIAREEAKAELLSKLDQFKELASELGFDLVKKGEKPTSVALTPQQSNINPGFKQQKNTREESDLSREEILAAREAAKRVEKPVQVTHSTSGIAAAIAPHVIPQHIEVKTTEGTKIVNRPKVLSETQQIVKGPAGIPIPIPRSIQDSDGETTITVVDTGGNATIQNRGRQLHQMRMNDEQSFYSKDCRPCKGVGIIYTRRGEKKSCRSCGGVGIII
jgi:hypothetical protein